MAYVGRDFQLVTWLAIPAASYDTKHTEPDMQAFIAYYRVSTQRQGVSGLGLEAQQETVTRHILGQTGQLVASHQEIESGKVDDRPELLKAIAHAKRARATLIVAKIDRLSRNAVGAEKGGRKRRQKKGHH